MVILEGEYMPTGIYERKDKVDLTGEIFGNLTVIEEVESYVSPQGKKQRR